MNQIIRIIGLAIVFWLPTVEASNLCAGYEENYRIRVRNFSSFDCTLSHHHFINGDLANYSELPKVTFKGLSDNFELAISRMGNVITLLDFQCGEGNTIELYSTHFRYRYEGILIDAKVLNQQNLQATIKKSKEDCNDWKASINYNTVEWTIRDALP